MLPVVNQVLYDASAVSALDQGLVFLDALGIFYFWVFGKMRILCTFHKIIVFES